MQKKLISRRTGKWAFLFTLPNMISFSIFFVIPVIMGIYFSFTNYNGLTKMEFIGLENYVKLFGDQGFYKVLKQTLLYVLCTVPLIYASTLGVALLLTSKELVLKSYHRVLIYIPTLFSTVTVGLTWRWIFGEHFGLINYMLENMGYNPIAWSTTPKAAFITTVIAFVWANTGFFMLIFIGGIENIDQNLYEAATIDGAGAMGRFLHITLPQLRPFSTIVLMLNTINAFKVFGEIVTLTGGGPGGRTTYMIQYIYETGFLRLKVGYASATSMVMFVILLVLSLINLKLTSGNEEG